MADPDIKEWHFHTYWFWNNPEDQNRAWQFREKIISQVKDKKFVVVCNGVTSEMLPGLNESNIPKFNTQPIGPHPCGSFETWVPYEHFSSALSFFTLHRGSLSILFHPLTVHELEDHTSRSMWLGPSYRLNLDVLSPLLPSIPLQYPELGLGYSAKSIF
uniref:DOPA 4,5-dioxygenase n=1 Tax=Arcella intermedia TaxID=1963864 RepID=A0A6B2LMK8_9EUKA